MSKGYVGRRNYISCSNMIYSRDLRIVLIFSLNQRGKGVFFGKSSPIRSHYLKMFYFGQTSEPFVFVFKFFTLVFVTKVQVNPGQSFIGAKHLKVIASTTAIHLN